jgi:acetylglutamate kinase
VRIGERAVATLTRGEARRAIEDGSIHGGMALKVRVALEAVDAGVPEVVIAGRARLEGGFAGTRIASQGK